MSRANKIVALVAFSLLAVAAVATVIVLVTSNGNPPTISVPQPISRSELMQRYAEINPVDRSATPGKVDTAADMMCTRLRGGSTTDQLITESTDLWRSNTTEVVKLFVSYRCPDYLKDFK